jgi:bifunctional DNA-binding transcriptional regulator/antitoxin component of YhaV-PrlF toxin-antitoxin module
MDKELQQICDDGGFEWTPLSEKKPLKQTLKVNDDGVLTFTPEILEATGWKEGDVLEWIDNKDGSFSLIKRDA